MLLEACLLIVFIKYFEDTTEHVQRDVACNRSLVCTSTLKVIEIHSWFRYLESLLYNQAQYYAFLEVSYTMYHLFMDDLIRFRLLNKR